MEKFIRPLILTDYLNYLKSIKGLSESTIKEYAYDLEMFIEYQIVRKLFNYNKDDYKANFDFKNINDYIDSNFFEKLSIQDFYAFLSFLDNRKNDTATTRSRKISALKSFYKYMYSEIEVIDTNIADKLTNPKISQRQPVYLTLSETEKLLETINKEKNVFLRSRDLAIVFTFLTTGMRLSELISIDLSDVNTDSFNIIGKGNKERTVYLTQNCQNLINNYIVIRSEYLKDASVDALFISTRKKRISKRAVQSTIDKYLAKAGFDTKIYSTHKLRHTAATDRKSTRLNSSH